MQLKQLLKGSLKKCTGFEPLLGMILVISMWIKAGNSLGGVG